MEYLNECISFGNEENGNVVITFEQYFNILILKRKEKNFSNLILVDKDYELKFVDLGEEFDPNKITVEGFNKKLKTGMKIELADFSEKSGELNLLPNEISYLKEVASSAIRNMYNDDPSTEAFFLSLGFSGKPLVQALTGKEEPAIYCMGSK